MENNKYIVAIDLGSSSVKAAAGTKDPDGRLNILDVVVKPLQGMVAGEVSNIEQVTASTKEAIAELEQAAGIDVSEAYAGISGQDIKCSDVSYFVYVSGEDGEIREEDVLKLYDSMNTLQPPEGVCILGRNPQKYVIDMQESTMRPVGRFGKQLDATFNFTLAGKNGVDRLSRTFSRMGIKQSRLYTNAEASAAAVLTDDDKELGVAVVDIGAGCTDVCIWQDKIMRYVGVIPIGANAINNDIRSIAIPDRYIERLKTTHGYAAANKIPEDKKGQIIKIKGRTARESKEISFFTLAQIIEARMLDILDNVIEEIKESGYADKLGAGIVLTGGGAKLKDIETLFRDKTKYDIRTGITEQNYVNEDSLQIASDPDLSSVIGLLLLGLKNSDIETSTHAPRRPREQPQENASETGKGRGAGYSMNEERGEDSRNGSRKRAVRTPEPPANNPSDTGLKHFTEEDEADGYDDFYEDGPKSKKAKKAKKSGSGGFGRRLKGIFTDIFEVVDDEEEEI